MEAAQLAGILTDGSSLESGSGWWDQATGCWIAASTPGAEPELWDQYLEGARRSYGRHGLGWRVALDRLRDGADTTLFFAAVDPEGRVVGGTRVVGPLRAPEESHALAE